jgi:hypothetical protein
MRVMLDPSSEEPANHPIGGVGGAGRVPLAGGWGDSAKPTVGIEPMMICGVYGRKVQTDPGIDAWMVHLYLIVKLVVLVI